MKKKKAPDLRSELVAGDGGEQEHKQRLTKYGAAKRHTNEVAEHIVQHEPTLHKEGDLLQSCSAWLIFRHFYHSNQYKLIGGCTCKKHLLCAMCALRRSAKTVREYEAKIQQVMQENPGLVPVLLTLTIKNGADLKERTLHLNSAVTRMIKNRSNAKSGNRHTTAFRLIDGAAGAFEFKRGARSGLWHPHIHMIALVPLETDLLEFEWNISQEWRRLTTDSFNVDVRPIDHMDQEKRWGAICEVFRYALKFGEMEITDQVHAYKVLKGFRLVRSFGSLYGVQVPDDLNDSIEEQLALQPYVDLVYEYSKKKGYWLKEITDTGDQLTGKNKLPVEKKPLADLARGRLPMIVKDKAGAKRIADKEYFNEWLYNVPF